MHALLKRAAELQGRTLTDFVVTAAREAAQRAIEDFENLRLSLEDQRRVAEAVLNAPEPTPALRRAFERRRALLGAGVSSSFHLEPLSCEHDRAGFRCEEDAPGRLRPVPFLDWVERCKS